MRKYYEGDTGGRYLVGTKSAGCFADVQTIAQAEDAARMWWSLTGDDGVVIIWSREKETIVKVIRRETGEEK